MRVISLLRSAVAGACQRPAGALAILTIIIGVVTMHSISGSPTSHGHAEPHETPAVAADPVSARPVDASQIVAAPAVSRTTELVTAAAVVRPAAAPLGSHGERGADGCKGCCADGLATAMCLMIVVTVLAMVVPVRGLLWRAPLELARSLTSAVANRRAVAAPSLLELCISRT